MPTPRSLVSQLPAYRPGRSAADAIAAHGIDSAIKLASNELAFEPLPSVLDVIDRAVLELHRYPRHGAPTLRSALAQHLGVDTARVAVGNGSVGLIQQLCLGYVDPGDRVVYGWPSFEAYPVFVSLVGGEAVAVPNDGATLDADAIGDAIDERTKLVFIANPNNPTSTALSADDLTWIAENTPDSALLVVDEAYREFVTDPEVPDALEILGDRDNVAVLRTFSKAHGLAGLRVGYLVGREHVVDTVDRLLVPFAVNHVAEAAACASLEANVEVRRRCKETTVERDRTADVLAELGFPVPVTQTNFVWLPTGAASRALGESMEQRGVVTRVFPDVGIRVTSGTPAENDRFLTAFIEAGDETDAAAHWLTP
ncbi:histidinol-phosphate transaminase [Actinospongicola halichondriae]|uniref:histidinol-phosphate transaminase n=1 Tax=Actinospongicola halichondriae TaxID=3236844 RepID=UPI003D53714D